KLARFHISRQENSSRRLAGKGQFLPGQHLASGAQCGGSYAAQNTVPIPRSTQAGEHRVTCRNRDRGVGREDVANELVRDVFALHPREVASFEYLSKIAVLLDTFGTLYLKISLGEFRLKKHIPELRSTFSPPACFAE